MSRVWYLSPIVVCLLCGMICGFAGEQEASEESAAPMNQKSLEKWLLDHYMTVVHDKGGDITEVGRRSGPPPGFNRDIIVALAGLPKLEKLDLQMTVLRDEYFVDVTGFDELKELRLDRTRVTGDVLSAFRNAKKLEILSLYDTPKIGKGLNTVPADSHKELILCGPEIGDETLQTISRFRNLQKLTVRSPLATDKGVLSLQSLKRLELLLVRAPVDYAVFNELSRQLPECLPVFHVMKPGEAEKDKEAVEKLWKAWGL